MQRRDRDHDKQPRQDDGPPSFVDRAGAGATTRSLPPRPASKLPPAAPPAVQSAVEVQLHASAAATQRHESDVFGWGQPSRGPATPAPTEEVAPIAARGVAGAPTSLPHAATIQASFGRHDVSGIGAHVGGDAAQASTAIGARAYAMGDQVAFRSAPDLFLAAHEAAHVVQQRGGVQLSGGVGQAGDRYEQHADAVASAVVRGASAESLLDECGSPSGAGATASMVQRQDADEGLVGETGHCGHDPEGIPVVGNGDPLEGVVAAELSAIRASLADVQAVSNDIAEMLERYADFDAFDACVDTDLLEDAAESFRELAASVGSVDARRLATESCDPSSLREELSATSTRLHAARDAVATGDVQAFVGELPASAAWRALATGLATDVTIEVLGELLGRQALASVVGALLNGVGAASAALCGAQRIERHHDAIDRAVDEAEGPRVGPDGRYR